jgi:hypothetical protein
LTSHDFLLIGIKYRNDDDDDDDDDDCAAMIAQCIGLG